MAKCPYCESENTEEKLFGGIKVYGEKIIPAVHEIKQPPISGRNLNITNSRPARTERGSELAHLYLDGRIFLTCHNCMGVWVLVRKRRSICRDGSTRAVFFY